MKSIRLALISLAFASVAGACNIPVFRYALERWQPDPCEVIVFHDSDLTPQHEAQLSQWESAAGDKQTRSNAKIIRANLSQTTSEYRDQWKEITASSPAVLPHVLVRTRLGPGRYANAWHGPMAQWNQAGVIDSPARRNLGERLLSGHSIVWLMIGSDDPERNKQVRELLAEPLQSLAKTVQLPTGIGLPGSELHSEIPLLLRFSMLEVDRTDPNEAFLVQWLSRFRPDDFAAGEPLIVPVFGRGRALEVIPASVLNESLLEDLTLFLCGACSCQVKEQNPGFDLLLAVDWKTELFGEDAAPQPAKRDGGPSVPELLSIPPGR